MKKLVAILGIIFLTSGNCSTLPDSGDRVLIGDHEYVLVKSGDWSEVTNGVEICQTVWAKMHNTESGRSAIHGRAGHTTVTNGCIITDYADGYEHVETIKQRAQQGKRLNTKTSTNRPSKPSRVPSRFDELRAKRRAALSQTNEVTVTIQR